MWPNKVSVAGTSMARSTNIPFAKSNTGLMNHEAKGPRRSLQPGGAHTEPRDSQRALLASRARELPTSLEARSFVEEFSLLAKSFLELLMGPSASGGGSLTS